ncbi:MAG: 4-alpha-glucanotransferase [Kofleriaceae bacterium]
MGPPTGVPDAAGDSPWDRRGAHVTALRELARSCGLEVEYASWRGQTVAAHDDAVLDVLAAMGGDYGFSIRRPDDVPSAITAVERERWHEIVPPVVVGWDGAIVVPLAMPARTDGAWELSVTTESGRVVERRGRVSDLDAEPHDTKVGAFCLRRAAIQIDELGYVTVRWRVGSERGESLGICAPSRAWRPDARDSRWGVFAPVYGLASEATGAAGDLSTLRHLMAQVERKGGRWLATLPILAALLDEPCRFSPYAPVSRHYWNELYLDLRALAGDDAVAVPPATGGARIDYRAQYRWRRAVFEPIAQQIAAEPARWQAIDQWAREHGVFDYAAFRAIGEHVQLEWPEWPAPWRHNVPVIETREDAVALGAEPSRVALHVIAQWAMQQQLEALDGKVGLYLDLPVGVGRGAYDVWRHRHLFLTTLAAGAPPDALFLGGQNWGLPPLSPVALRRDRYRYFIRCVRHHMSVARLLRIDHVMGLFRLYCVPGGRPATDGVYLTYRAEELLAILTLESMRARCALVGEDLGTVPDYVRPAMAEHGLYRIHVGQWALPTRVGDAPGLSPPDCVASLNTHDTATFSGWWRGADIEDRRELGLITADQESLERMERSTARTALLAHVDSLRSDPALSDLERAMVGATADLAQGPADIVLVSLDDLVLEPVPHNVPGTTEERPNWQRRIDRWADALDDERASPAAAAAIAAVVAARSGSA